MDGLLRYLYYLISMLGDNLCAVPVSHGQMLAFGGAVVQSFFLLFFG